MNLLAYGEFPDNPNDYSASNLLLPRGAIINGRFDEIHPVDLTAPDEIQEFVTHSWYTYGNGNNDKGLHPWDGLTEPQLVMGEHYKGTKPLSNRWMSPPNIHGLNRRAGRDMRWR